MNVKYEKIISVRLNNTDTNEVTVKYYIITGAFDENQWKCFNDALNTYFDINDDRADKVRKECGYNISSAIEFACNESKCSYRAVPVDAAFDFNC